MLNLRGEAIFSFYMSHAINFVGIPNAENRVFKEVKDFREKCVALFGSANTTPSEVENTLWFARSRNRFTPLLRSSLLAKRKASVFLPLLLLFLPFSSKSILLKTVPRNRKEETLNIIPLFPAS